MLRTYAGGEQALSNVAAGSGGIPKESCLGSVPFREHSCARVVGGRKQKGLKGLFEEPGCPLVACGPFHSSAGYYCSILMAEGDSVTCPGDRVVMVLNLMLFRRINVT